MKPILLMPFILFKGGIMEKLDLYEKNGIFYIEKSKMKIALSFSKPLSVFSEKYIPIQLDNKPILSLKKSGIDRMFESAESILGFKVDIDPQKVELFKKFLSNPKNLMNTLKNMGVELNEDEEEDFKQEILNIDESSQRALESILESYNQIAEMKFDALLGQDMLNKFITLIEFNKKQITFFTEKAEVGQVVGTKYHILNLIDRKYIPLPPFIPTKEKEIVMDYDLTGKYIYFEENFFNKLISKYSEIPESKLDYDYLPHIGSINETVFKLPVKINHGDITHAWIGKLPKSTDKIFNIEKLIKEKLPFLKGYIPLTFFKEGVILLIYFLIYFLIY